MELSSDWFSRCGNKSDGWKWIRHRGHVSQAVPETGFPDTEEALSFYDGMLEKLENEPGAIVSHQPVTCQVRYTLNLSQLEAFEAYARAWMTLVDRYGGVHHGYFIPRANPDVKDASFPGLGYDGPADVAVALFTFPSEEVYRNYREAVAADPECLATAALVRETHCFTRYERLFLRPVTPGG